MWLEKEQKKTIGSDELIDIEPVVAIVKDLVTRNIEDEHIVFCEDASNIISHPSKARKASVPMLSLKIGIIATMVYVILVLVLVLFLMSFTGKLCMRLVLVSLRTLMRLFTLLTRIPFAPLAL